MRGGAHENQADELELGGGGPHLNLDAVVAAEFAAHNTGDGAAAGQGAEEEEEDDEHNASGAAPLPHKRRHGAARLLTVPPAANDPFSR